MSLNFDLSAVTNRETMWRPDGSDLVPLTKAIVFATMHVQIGTITGQNAKEFFRRLDLWQRAHGVLMHKGQEPYYITQQDVNDHIGLRTNVFPSYSAKKWETYFKKVLFDNVQDKVRAARYREEVAAQGKGDVNAV